MNKVLNEKTLALFFTRGMSLRRWAQNKTLSREVALYNRLAPHFKKIYFLTYGDQSEIQYQNQLNPKIEIRPKKSRLPASLYSLLLPLYHYRVLRRCSFLKSNQVDGAWSAYLAKLLNPKAKFIFRTGFLWSLFLKKESRLGKHLIRPIEKWLFRVSDLALVASCSDKKYVKKKYKIPSPKVKLLPNFVDPNLFKPQPMTPKFPKKIIFAGRIHPQKNLLTLIRALQDTGISLDLIGEGPLQKSLKKSARDLGVSLACHPRIPHSRLPFKLNRYLVFVLPSLYEGSPKILLEAMACGLTCVASAIPGHKEIIIHQKNGLLCKPNPQDLRSNILRLFRNPKLRKRLGENARKTIIQNYSLNKISARERKIYESLS